MFVFSRVHKLSYPFRFPCFNEVGNLQSHANRTCSKQCKISKNFRKDAFVKCVLNVTHKFLLMYDDYCSMAASVMKNDFKRMSDRVCFAVHT